MMDSFQKEQKDLPPKPTFYTFFAGLIGGAADIVPGVSGGTVYFILGIYADLLKSISTFGFSSWSLLLKGKLKAFTSVTAWKFLSVLGVGVLFSIITLAHFIVFVLNSMPGRQLLFAFFFGLVLASLMFCWKLIKEHTITSALYFSIACILSFLICSQGSLPNGPISIQLSNTEALPMEHAYNFNPDTKVLSRVDVDVLPVLQAQGLISGASHQESSIISNYVHPKVFVAGVFAVTAMLLPGISGSYILTVLGMYGPVLSALIEFMGSLGNGCIDVYSLSLLLNLGLGIVLGAIAASGAISWCLRQYHDYTISALSGFMIGSLQTIWPFFEVVRVYNPYRLQSGIQVLSGDLLPPQLTLDAVPVYICIGAGVLIIMGLEYRFLNNPLSVKQ